MNCTARTFTVPMDFASTMQNPHQSSTIEASDILQWDWSWIDWSLMDAKSLWSWAMLEKSQRLACHLRPARPPHVAISTGSFSRCCREDCREDFSDELDVQSDLLFSLATKSTAIYFLEDILVLSLGKVMGCWLTYAGPLIRFGCQAPSAKWSHGVRRCPSPSVNLSNLPAYQPFFPFPPPPPFPLPDSFPKYCAFKLRIATPALRA